MKEQASYTVSIHCEHCGERFKLKGRVKKGKLETGFKRCLCDNENRFKIAKEELM